MRQVILRSHEETKTYIFDIVFETEHQWVGYPHFWTEAVRDIKAPLRLVKSKWFKVSSLNEDFEPVEDEVKPGKLKVSPKRKDLIETWRKENGPH